MKKGYLRNFISYYKKYTFRFITVLFASLVMALLSVMYPIITRRVFQVYVKESPVDVNAIIYAGIILIVIYVCRFGLKLYVDYFGHSVGTDIQSDMRRDLFNKYEDLLGLAVITDYVQQSSVMNGDSKVV